MLYHIFISLSISINETIIVFMALGWWRAQGWSEGRTVGVKALVRS
ncbi:MAG: hypothetical protein IGQ45_09355 [Cyanobacterium sp. T60_A2020_053]|nr:hypothetical protein [Cyanobacterium sp. T60_A2020_053]